ncbi:DUF4384 domain-containing protein [candidate division GN15 bacterium]|nr:DUF4384 domain-containing protein [candidate division GN15 bacterium]
MLRSKLTGSLLLALLMLLGGVVGGAAQDIQRGGDDDDRPVYYSDRPRIDRYLDAEVWTNHSDGEYYVGDNIQINFRVSRDAFVAIYSVDTRGMVNLIFPTDPGQDNFVRGGESYRLPGANAGYDLVVNGPEGVENIQIIASRERFPVPNWYRNSGLVCDWDDRYNYMDYLNGRYFIRYDGQRFAYDRAAIFVNEWEDYYFRPVYRPYYPSWSVCGNVYIDYGWGHSVYVNGVYWGCTPLYLPRIAVGWHTVTIYDRYGYCWENDVHISYYNTVVLDRTVVKTTSTTKSKYKTVREVGYRNPVNAGYTNFERKTKAVLGKDASVYTQSVGKSASKSTGKSMTHSSGKASATTSKGTRSTGIAQDNIQAPKSKKYVRGSTDLVKTDRGYETDLAATARGKSKSSNATRSSTYRPSSDGSAGVTSSSRYKTRKGVTDPRSSSSSMDRSTTRGQSSGYYQKKSATSRSSSSSSYGTRKNSSSSSGSYRSKSSNRSSSSYNSGSKRSNSSSTLNRSKGSSSKSSGSYRKAPAPSKSSSTTIKRSAPSKSSSSSGKSRSSGSSSKGSSSKGKSKK